MARDYTISVLEYGQTVDQPVGLALYGEYNAGTNPMPYGFVVLESDETLILVDTGFEDTGSGAVYRETFNVNPFVSPVKALAELGKSPEDVEHVILTHAHYDHMGALDCFPEARFYLQQTELEKWQWILGLGQRFSLLAAACNPDDVAKAERLVEEGRMELLDGPVSDLFPGISLEVALETHSYAQQYVIVDTETSGRYIIAGDAAYSRSNFVGLEGDGVMVPVGFGVGSQTQMLLALDRMYDLVEGEVERIVIVHDPETYEGAGIRTGAGGMRIAEINARRRDETH